MPSGHLLLFELVSVRLQVDNDFTHASYRLAFSSSWATIQSVHLNRTVRTPAKAGVLPHQEIIMEIDTARARELLNKRDEIDAELAAIFSGAQVKKPVKCSHCQQEGHTARTCSQKQAG